MGRNFRGVAGRKKWGADEGGRWPKNRAAWVDCNNYDAAIYIGPSGEDEPTTIQGLHPQRVLVLHEATSATWLALELLDLTAEELTALRDFIVAELDAAIPLAAELDNDAKERYERDNDDLHARLYRRVPVVYDRRGQKPQHD